MGLVTRIDPFGRIADREITSRRETRSLLQNRHAIFLGRTGIDGRFVDDNIAFLEGLARPSHIRMPACGQPVIKTRPSTPSRTVLTAKRSLKHEIYQYPVSEVRDSPAAISGHELRKQKGTRIIN